jgi:uncharacterized membrane protein
VKRHQAAIRLGGKAAIRLGGKFAKHVVPKVIKPMHSLWNEVIGFFFLCFAAIFGFRTITYYKIYTQAVAADAATHMVRVIVTGFFALVMAAFGISSFLKARRISRS